MNKVIPSHNEGYVAASQRAAFNGPAKIVTAYSTNVGDMATAMQSEDKYIAMH